VPSGTTAALQFDENSSQLVNALGYKGITGTNPRSMSAWIKTTSNDMEPIISWGRDTAGEKWTFRVQNQNGTAGAIRVEVNGGYVVGNLNVADGQWHHVAATWEDDGSPNANDVKLYVDGARQATSARSGQSMNTASDEDVRIGRAVVDGRFFHGTMDEVRVYDHALSGQQVRMLATGSPLAIPSLNYDAGLDTDGNNVWEDSVGLYATGVGLDYELTGVTRNTSPATSLPGIRASYVFDGSATAVSAGNIEDRLRGDPTDDDASFEVWFKPADLSGQEIVWEYGAGTNGTSFTLDDNLLQVVTKDGGDSGGVAVDLTALQGDFIQAIATIDRKTNQLAVFINGVEVAGSPVSLGSFGDWCGTNGDGLGSRGGSGTGGHGGFFGALNDYDNFVGEIAMARMYTEVLSAQATAGLGAYVRRRRRAA